MLRKRVDVAPGGHGALAWVEAVGAGHHLEQQRRCPSTDDGHRSEVVEHRLDDHRARVRHQPVRRLHPVEAAERRRDADRSALVATDRHVDDAAGDERGGARRRAARRVAVPPGVVGLARGRWCGCCPSSRSTRSSTCPRIVAPASSTRSTTVASNSGTYPSRVDDPFIIGTPATAILSFTATVRPASGPCGGAVDLGPPVPRVERVVLGCGADSRPIAGSAPAAARPTSRPAARSTCAAWRRSASAKNVAALGIEVDPEACAQRLQPASARSVRHLVSSSCQRRSRRNAIDIGL